MKRFAISVLAGLATLGASAQSADARPRLVVGIVVDQLRTDYIEYLQNRFGERGFKTLLRDGVFMRDVEFNVSRLDAASAMAMLHTGAYPSQTGVPSGVVYDVTSAGVDPRLPLVSSSGSVINNDSFTPTALRLSTVADELVVAGSGVPAVYSVAMDPQQAVILAGHAGKGAYWVNNTSGNWATSSYYGSLPAVLTGRNLRHSLSQRIDTMQYGRVRFSRQDRDAYKKFAASPLANAEVTDVAIELLNSLDLGSKAGQTDMLNIAYSLAPFRYSAEAGSDKETVDAYRRLDAQIARIIEAVDRRVGADNSIIWLTSTGYCDDALPVEEKYRIPGGEFSTRKAKSLLNSFLSARFGSGEYVTSIRGGQVFLSQAAIDSHRLDTRKVADEARLFLVKMDGVAEAFTKDEILSAKTGETESLRRAIDPRSAGDIMVRFAPGWSVAYDDQSPVQIEYVRESAVMTPALVRAPGLKPQVISTPVEAVSLAPAVCGALHIRSPNGARSRSVF